MTGTIINALAVLLGGTVGLILKNKLPKKISGVAITVIPLFALCLGIAMFIKSENMIVIVFSLIIGTIFGEFINLEKNVNSLSEKMKAKMKIKSEHFTNAMITTFLLFCVGALTILGAIKEGLTGDTSLLITKSILDGFSAIALAASMGIGVLFSVIPMVIFQGGLTIFASYLSDFFTNTIILDISAVGGVLLVAMALNILKIKKFKVVNMLPSLLFATCFSYFFSA